jgi:hypothetical protein
LELVSQLNDEILLCYGGGMEAILASCDLGTSQEPHSREEEEEEEKRRLTTM